MKIFPFAKTVLALILVSTTFGLLAGDHMFYEMQGQTLKQITQTTNQLFEPDAEPGSSWFGLIFDAQLTAAEGSTLQLSSGLEIYLERESLTHHPRGFLLWSGQAFDNEGLVGHAQFIILDGAVEGHVALGHRFLVVTSLGNGLHRISLKEEAPELEVITAPEPGGSNQRASCLGTPTLSVFSDFCLGYNTASWTSVSGATYYDLKLIGGGVIYSGSATSAYVNIGCCANKYLQVRACDGSGCGTYSASKLARYYSTCL